MARGGINPRLTSPNSDVFVLFPAIEYIDAKVSVLILFTVLLHVKGSLIVGFRDANVEEVGEKAAWVGVGVIETCSSPDDIDLVVTSAGFTGGLGVMGTGMAVMQGVLIYSSWSCTAVFSAVGGNDVDD